MRAGLWSDAYINLKDNLLCEQSDQGRANLNLSENVDWVEVYKLAGEQSVIGLVLAGIETSIVR